MKFTYGALALILLSSNQSTNAIKLNQHSVAGVRFVDDIMKGLAEID